MNSKIFAVASACVALSTVVACSSSSSGGSGGGTTGSGGSTSSASSTATGAGGDPTPATSCVKKGDKGNAGGVGEYCTPNGGQCSNFSVATACLADLGQDQWFCSKIGCKADADCGMDAVCHMDPQGSACIPSKCESGTTSSGTGAGGGTSTGSSTGTGM